MRETLIVFAREPVAGRVKQRLARETAEVFALRAYRRMLERSLRLARSWQRSATAGCERCLVVAASDAPAGGWLSTWCTRSGTGLVAQVGNTLGERMHRAFCQAFASGAARVVLVGCDCPGLSLADRREAFRALQDADLVLAPTLDGGYCLIGLSEPRPELFETIAWGTAVVTQQTLRRAGSLRVACLADQRDVDHLRDWLAWCAAREAAGLPEDAFG